MPEVSIAKTYPPAEERLNVLTHALGLLLSIVALPYMVFRAAHFGGVERIVAAAVFGLSLIVLYASSTTYHSVRDAVLRAKMRIVDHASIFFLIAGTYTPFTLLVLDGSTGWLVFSLVWTLAITGVVLKLFFTGRFRHLSTAMYLATGWVIVIAIGPLVENLDPDGLNWLIAGGLSYTIGALLYGFGKMPFNHATFHAFVLAGSICHFVAVVAHVLPVAGTS